MDEFLSSHQFQVIETFSTDLSLCIKSESKLTYTLKYIPKTDQCRSAQIKNETFHLKSSKIYHKNIISLLFSEDSENFQLQLFEPCTSSLSSFSNFDPLQAFSQICQGVKYLHSKNIIIKNLSTHNILLKDRTIKISNLESAQSVENLNSSILDNGQNTEEDYWKAPEVLDSGNYSEKSDIYNLGLIFYFLVFRQDYKNSIPETGKKQFQDIFQMTLNSNPKNRVNVSQLLRKVYENYIPPPIIKSSFSCLTPRLFTSTNSTESLVKSILSLDFRSMDDLNVARLIKKVETTPAKISKFLKILQKKNENSSNIVKVRSLTLLFTYIQKAPLVAFTLDPGILELTTYIARRQIFEDSAEEHSEVIQGLSLCLTQKYHVVRSNLPNLSGSFKKVITEQNSSVHSAKSIAWYWESIQSFTEFLQKVRNLTEARIIRLVLCEEQLHIYNFLSESKLTVKIPAFQQIVAQASGLFLQDHLKFPTNKEPLKNKPPIGKISNFSRVKIDEENKFQTVYRTPLQSIPLSTEISPQIHDKSTIKHCKLTYTRIIGSGTSCEVWLGTYNKMQVAIKQPKSNEELSKTEFNREMQVLVSLSHANLVKYIGNCFDPVSCLVIEYCPGGDLFKLLHNKSVVLSWAQKIKMLKDISAGMAHLHSHNFIHRDLKSLNLLLSNPVTGPEDEVLIKISDFGLTREFSEGDFMTGQTGTCHWMAPEVLRSSNYTLKADVYSFAILMYEIITRESPYKWKRTDEITSQVLNSGLRPDLSKVPANCPSGLVSLMKLCWENDFELRPSFEQISSILSNKQY